MFRTIIVPAPGEETHDAVFQTALAIARGTSGHLAFVHVHPDPQQLLIAMAAGDFGGGAGIGEYIEGLQQDMEHRRDRARQAVMTFCAARHVPLTGAAVGVASASFQVETGDEGQVLAAYARAGDLIVLGRAREGEVVALDLLETVLLGSGRPLLIAPAEPAAEIGRRIAIAWKDTAEAARAVASATPLLASADAVTIVTVTEGGHNDTRSSERLCRFLQRHNPATTLRVMPATGKDAGEVLLAAVTATGADLLVMGGYSHSRMREVVLGGITRRVLRAAHLPVLMAH